jgi:hypothetical protein
MRVPFNQIFAEIDGHLIPRRHIGIGNISVAAGTLLSPALVISGINIGKLTDRDLVVEMEDGITMIQGFHRDDEPPPRPESRARPKPCCLSLRASVEAASSRRARHLEGQQMRMSFDTIFTEIEGCFVPQFHIGAGPVVIAKGVPIPPELTIGGLTIGKLKDYDLAVEVEDGIIMIHGFYRDDRAELAVK